MIILVYILITIIGITLIDMANYNLLYVLYLTWPSALFYFTLIYICYFIFTY